MKLFRIFSKSFSDKPKRKGRLWLVLIFILALAAGFFCYPQLWDKGADFLNNEKKDIKILSALPDIPHFKKVPFRLGLDLRGGTHLVYEADLSNIKKENYSEAMEGVRDVIERRVNIFGVTEPLVQTNKAGDHYCLIVELAGIKDIQQAIKMIGETPSLDFREERSESERNEILEAQKQNQRLFEDPYFKPTMLTGRYLKNAQLNFDPNTYQPLVNLQFDNEGAKIFEELTTKNVGKRLAIYLDGVPISIPQVKEPIAGGRAQITGKFSMEEAKELVQRLNAGALPVPIKLISQKTVGPILGEISLRESLKAGIFGFLAIFLFLIIFYRIPGFFASLSLSIYLFILLASFKLIPVTLTLGGIAGFLLSMGMAVDANILIFSRMREELKEGRSYFVSIEEGLRRAWPSIRDGNLTTILVGLILFIFGTGFVKGFALTLVIGNLVGMFTAIIITNNFLKLFPKDKSPKLGWLWR